MVTPAVKRYSVRRSCGRAVLPSRNDGAFGRGGALYADGRTARRQNRTTYLPRRERRHGAGVLVEDVELHLGPAEAHHVVVLQQRRLHARAVDVDPVAALEVFDHEAVGAAIDPR